MDESYNPTQSAIPGGMARRDPHWDELPIDSKLERMRGEVKRLMRMVEAQQRTLAVIRAHRHATDGSLLVAIDQMGSGRDEAVGYRRDEQWF